MSSELFTDNAAPVASRHVLPCPSRERWQPLRSGVLNIFKYDEEEFLFEEGRLLLRGNNGAGKSRVLALQLPFLLDGEMASHRVEPDGDPAKRVEWNLLMNKYENRLGYTWIEFGRRDSGGAAHYVTLGCGLHARKGTGIPSNARWFFVTRQRVGETLRLMSENRVPLSRERLEAAIGQASVYRTAAEYRSAVDEALFGLGVRYGPLIELLLQLRRPQIMRDFKADDLSRLLSEALPPLSPRLIENVSVSFRSLESDRQQLTELTEVRKSVDIFVQNYSHYVRVAVRRRAADMRRAHSQFETAQREIKRLKDEIEQNGTALIAAETEEGRVEETLAAAHEIERTLLASPEMKSAEDLRYAREARDDRAKRVEEAEGMRRQNHVVRDQRSKERKEAENFVARENDAVVQWHLALSEVWQETGLSDLGFPSRDAADAGARKLFDQTMANRAKAINVVREKNLELEKCVAQRREEETRFDQRRDDVMRCDEMEAGLRGQRRRALETLVEQIYLWEGTLQVLPILKGEDWNGLLEAWLETPDAASPLAERVDLAYQSAMQLVSEERGQSERTLKEQSEARREIVGNLETLRAGRQPEPPTPYTRVTGSRLDRPGAPALEIVRIPRRNFCRGSCRIRGCARSVRSAGWLGHTRWNVDRSAYQRPVFRRLCGHRPRWS